MPARRERFLPLSQQDLVAALLDDPRLAPADRPAFAQLARLLASVLHFEFHAQLEQLKRCYAPFDPDRDTVPLLPPAAADLQRCRQDLVAGLRALLRAANYEEVAPATLLASLRGESLFRVRLAVDFDDFADLVLFRRGHDERTVTLRTWFGLSRRELRFVNYDRVALLVRFRDRAWFDAKGRRELPFVPDTTVLKLFRNVPAADLEMLFPNTEVRMKPIDMLLLGVPAAVGGVVVLATKLLGTLLLLGSLFAFWLGLRDEAVVLDQTALVALVVGVGTLGAFVWKQWTRFKSRKIRFLQALTENLYFKNLDSNRGVLHRLVDDAEEEDGKEALLAFWLLHTGGPQSQAALDRAAEAWLQQRCGRAVDFEVGDAVQKLVRLGLAQRAGETFSALPLAAAPQELDRRWDGYFGAGG
ncbi:MAG: DUF3754 domain-containing protein [Planctomycetes bacterium]|nr:DUF3754 domain-containing protein [Planctomycetota bacterium]